MANNDEFVVQENGTNTLSENYKFLSSRLPQDPDTSTRHIRFSTPPSLQCTSSPELLPSSNVSWRVRARPETPSALAILAAVCSSPSVRWDGVKHRYGEGHGKSIWCERDLRTHRSSSPAHNVDPTNPSLPLVYGERSLIFRDTIKESMVPHKVPDAQKAFTVEDEDDEDIPTQISISQDYFSESPSSPPTLIFSSPYNHVSYDLSSYSERSSTPPLSSPGQIQRKTAIDRPIESTHGIDTDKTFDYSPTKLRSILSEEVCRHEKYTSPILEEVHDVDGPAVKHLESQPCNLKVTTTDYTPSLSPPQAAPSWSSVSPSSPLSSLMSSPLSELVDEGPLSPTASRFSMLSDVVSLRSVSPDMDMDINICHPQTLKSKEFGRRASTNIIRSNTRRMSDLSSSRPWRRSDTAPPQMTPSKRPRQSSPSSPSLRLLRVRRLSSPSSPPSCSNVLVTSSTTLEENRQSHQKQTKTRKGTKSVSTSRDPLKFNMTIKPHHPSNHAVSQLPRRKVKSSKQRITQWPNENATASESYSMSSAELKALPVTGFLVETLALSRASAITAPELLRAVLKSQPQLMEERTEKLWLELVRHILGTVRMFGKIERQGMDAADRPLEDQWFYIPENDEEGGRAELLRGLMPKKRDVTKRSKQYYFEPVQKVSRWDPEDDY